MVSRRRFLTVGAGAGTALAVPVGLTLNWSGQDFVRDGFSPDYLNAPAGEESWMNWSGIEKATPKQIVSPTTVQELSDLIKGATTRVRPVGSSHSFTGLVPTEGIMVDCNAFKGLLNYNETTGEATFGAGTHIFHATAVLDEIGRAFANLPDIDQQTLAGAFSTATHGTGSNLTALHDFITGFQIVTANGDILDVTKENNPDLFASGKVSLGALGIITQYTLKTVPEFNLHRRLTVERIDSFLEKVDELSVKHRNFEFFYVPSTGSAAWLSHDLYDGTISEHPENEDDDDALESLKMLRDTMGWWPWLRRKTAQAAFPTGLMEEVRDESWQLLATTRTLKFNEMEYHLPREKSVDVLKKIIKLLDQRKEAFYPVEYRVIASDDAWLSPFNGGSRASIAVHTAADEDYEYLFSEIEPIFKAAGGRPHWGKLHSLGKPELNNLYPEFDRFNELRRSLDPTGKFLNPHLAKLFGESFIA